MVAVHLSPDDGIGYLTPADELDEIELGSRADLWLTHEQLAVLYTREADRVRSMIYLMVGSIASVTSHRGLPFPEEWWPSSAGGYKTGLRK